MEALAVFRPMAGCSAISAARARLASASVSRGTTRFTIPSSRATSAVMARPVNRSSFAFRTPNSQGWPKYSTPLAPKATTGSWKVASSLATTRSKGQTSMSPPAITLPCTATIVGFGMFRQRQQSPK